MVNSRWALVPDTARTLTSVNTVCAYRTVETNSAANKIKMMVMMMKTIMMEFIAVWLLKHLNPVE